MRSASDGLKGVLSGGAFAWEWVVDVFYGPDRVGVDLPVESADFSWDLFAELPSSGQIDFVFAGGRSWVPTHPTDVLSPFGQVVNVSVKVTAGRFTELVQVGRFRIDRVLSAEDVRTEFEGRSEVTGSRVSVAVTDLLVGPKRDGFLQEEAPRNLGSCWGELQRLTGMQLLRSVPDAAIPARVVYVAEQGARLRAVGDLAAVLGGLPGVTPFGALTVIPTVPGPVAGELVLGAGGQILDTDFELDSEGVYNEVVGNFEDNDRNPIHAVAQLTEGPLSIFSAFGRYTRYYASDFVKTKTAADSAVGKILVQSMLRTVDRKVVCLFNPLYELGDTLSVQQPDGKLLVGQVVRVELSDAPEMTVTLRVVEWREWVKHEPPPWVVNSNGLFPGSGTFPGPSVFPGMRG